MVTGDEREELVRALQALANHVRTRELHQASPSDQATADALWARAGELYAKWADKESS